MCDVDNEVRRLKWNEFVKKYHALLDEYGVEFDWGCGCCSGDHIMDGEYVKDYGVRGFDRA